MKCGICGENVWFWQSVSNISVDRVHTECHQNLLLDALKDRPPETTARFKEHLREFERATGVRPNVNLDAEKDHADGRRG